MPKQITVARRMRIPTLIPWFHRMRWCEQYQHTYSSHYFMLKGTDSWSRKTLQRSQYLNQLYLLYNQTNSLINMVHFLFHSIFLFLGSVLYIILTWKRKKTQDIISFGISLSFISHKEKWNVLYKHINKDFQLINGKYFVINLFHSFFFIFPFLSTL